MDGCELSPAIPQLVSGNLTETAEFFKNFLGFQVVNLMMENNFLSIKRGLTEIHFWQASDRQSATAIGAQSSCYIRVKNITVLFEELKERKTPFRYELQKMPWGMNEMQIDDPFGNAIRFGEEIK